MGRTAMAGASIACLRALRRARNPIQVERTGTAGNAISGCQGRSPAPLCPLYTSMSVMRNQHKKVVAPGRLACRLAVAKKNHSLYFFG
jgi:hypothetical protein